MTSTYATPQAADTYRADRWWIVVVLLLLYMIASVDRFVPSMIVDPLKRDLALTDAQIGLLMGPAFSVTFIIASFPAGWLVDHVSRRLVVFASIGLWALAAAAGAFAHDFRTLLIARMVVGIGEAGLYPAAHAMIADSFPRRQLASAISLFTAGVIAGTALSLGLGGLIIEAAHGGVTLPLAGPLRDWQFVLLLTALPGLAASGLIFTFREPMRRHRLEDAAAPTLRAFARYVASRRAIAVCYVFSFCVMAAVTIAIQLWTPAYMARTFSWTPAQYGVRLGLLTLVCGTAGKLFSGILVDRLSMRGVHDAPLAYYMAALALSLPMLLIGFSMRDPWVFLLCLAPVHLLMIPMMGFSVAGLMALTPNEFRGRTSALFMTAVTIMTGLGPSLVPWINASLFGDANLRAAITTLATVGSLICLAALQLGRRPYREAAAGAGDQADPRT